ncbi:hypothetical protein SprV_0100081400 [Sparganum proliferum]
MYLFIMHSRAGTSVTAVRPLPNRNNIHLSLSSSSCLFFFFSSPPPRSPDQQDSPRNNRPKRRTALLAQELARYKVNIAALNETRFSEQGQLEEVDAGYTFF